MRRVIWLVRHAEPEYPGGKKIYLGQKLDPPLSTQGKEQARSAAALLNGAVPDAAYVSPMLRCRETAVPFLKNGVPDPTVLQQLTELNTGSWEGLPMDDVWKSSPEHFRNGCLPPPGGETNEQGLKRVSEALEYMLRNPGKAILCVTHGGLGRLMLCLLTHTPLSEKRSFRMNHACIWRLEFEDTRFINACLLSPAEKENPV